jgi:hypothetical protein
MGKSISIKNWRNPNGFVCRGNTGQVDNYKQDYSNRKAKWSHNNNFNLGEFIFNKINEK